MIKVLKIDDCIDSVNCMLQIFHIGLTVFNKPSAKHSQLFMKTLEGDGDAYTKHV